MVLNSVSYKLPAQPRTSVWVSHLKLHTVTVPVGSFVLFQFETIQIICTISVHYKQAISPQLAEVHGLRSRQDGALTDNRSRRRRGSKRRRLCDERGRDAAPVGGARGAAGVGCVQHGRGGWEAAAGRFGRI